MKRTIIITTTVLALVLIACTIVVVFVVRNAQIEAKKAACEQWGVGSLDYYVCIDRADD